HNQQVVRYYNLCDIFVLPSVSSTQEGFGLVALEAMACKRPVVITSIVGVSGDVEKENAGIVIEPKNTEVLSRGPGFWNNCFQIKISAGKWGIMLTIW
ncbi:MAG: glycosyltransferase, partial [Deltaproteobacteria bacterium]|nr:glycosyltransferase [Deltaproteobacteria bacterium]